MVSHAISLQQGKITLIQFLVTWPWATNSSTSKTEFNALVTNIRSVRELIN
jgi:hypothetical protein